MLIHPRGNPDKEECLRILDEIEDIIPNKNEGGYAKQVQEYLKDKGHERIPSFYSIQSVRNRRSYNLDVAKALRVISKKAEAERRALKKNKISQGPLFESAYK